MHSLIKKFVINVGFLFFLTRVVKSDEVNYESQCSNDYKDMNNKTITNIEEYCDNKKTCIVKCCGYGEILDFYGVCNTAKRFKKFYPLVNYDNISIYSWDGTAVKKSGKEKVLVQNKIMGSSNCTAEYFLQPIEFYVLEDGSLNALRKDVWFNLKKLSYCIDFRLHAVIKNNEVKSRHIKTVFRYIVHEEVSTDNIFSEIIRLISCFFILLVLLVYMLLPGLRNFPGLILMAYIASLFVAYLLRAAFTLYNRYTTPRLCKILSPILYYALLSSFFWLNIMSFDIWRTIRGDRQCRQNYRKGHLVKFLKYCIFAWGIPFLLASAATILDNIDLGEWPIVRPPFDSCLAVDEGVLYYINIPIGIITVINIMLFLMTIYNIWLIKQSLNQHKESQKSNKETNRFITSIKLSLLMGVSWALDFIQTANPWISVSINFYNAFIGVTIFYIFVFNKPVLRNICKKFGIKSNWILNLLAKSEQSKNESIKLDRCSTSKRPRSNEQESKV